MPRRATHLLRWSPEHATYELWQHGAPLRPPVAPDTPAWFAWLADASSFSFQCATGDIYTLRKERVQRGGAYWYAYHRSDGRMTKRYLGRDGDLTLARLEATPPRDRYVTNTTRRPSRRGSRATTPSETPLLATRMLMPRTPARVVSRTHVWHRLQRGLERPLTLLTAPPGFGKTTSLAAWARQMNQTDQMEAPVAWVSLDASDSEPGQFWAYVLAALEQASPGVTGGALSMSRSMQAPPLPVILRALLNALVAAPREIVLVLDDYHLISAPAIHETLASLLEHPPACLHLYLASRQEPPLPLARLRARDEVNEIRADDLRFRLDEVAEFLAEVMEKPLPFEDVLALAERTDGWIAGLQLAGLSLQQHPDPAAFVASFSGSNRHVMQYLGDEALAAQPADVRAFLLRTALLDRMCGSLCDALTGENTGRAMLERLTRASLFVVALDDEGRWYRYDHLFADLLRHHLREESPDLLPDLHRRAARWLESDGQATEAAQHLFAIPDYAEAAALIERIADDLLRTGDLVTLRGLLERLPQATLAEHPALALTLAEACYARGQLAAADRHITTAEQSVTRMNSSTDDEQQQRRLIGRIACDRAVLSSMYGNADATIAYVQTMQENLPEDDSLRRGGAAITMGHAWRLKGDLAAADSAYAEAVRLSSAAGSPFLAALATDMRTLVANARGQLHLAANLSRQIIAMAESRGEAARSLAGNAWANLGWRLYEWNDLAGAEDAYRRALMLGEQWGDIEDQVDGHLWLSLVYQARGDEDESRRSLQRARDLLATVEREGHAFPWLPPLVAAASARLAVAQGRLAEAEQWMAELRREYGGNSTIRPVAELACARVLLALGNADEAEALLETLLPRVVESGQVAHEIEIRMLLALAWQRHGETAHALHALGEAIARAMAEGYIRLFLDEGAPMIALLRQLRGHQNTNAQVAGYCTKLLTVAGAENADAGTTHPADPQSALIEPLSVRELEVLHLLAEGHSNQEIANQLVVALSTIKTHVHHLYAKLQTPDRLRAVTRARALGLLDARQGQQQAAEAAGEGAMTASAERRDLDMRGITAVEVATFGGELSVVTGADHPRMEATTFGNATYSVERVGSLLYIVGKKRGFFYFGNGVGFRLWLPGDLALRLANVSADIRVRGDLRTLSVNVVHGGVELRASNLDEAKLRAVHGRVVAHGVTGKLDITVTPGEVRVINSGGELHVSATPGNVRLEQVMLAPGTSHDVTASPGDIEIVGIHAPGGLELNSSTTHPPITADLPGYDDVYHKKRSLYARRPGPRRAKLTLHASGSLSIKG